MKRTLLVALCLICMGIFTQCNKSDKSNIPDYHAENLTFETHQISDSIPLLEQKSEPFLTLKYSFVYPKEVENDTLLNRLKKNILLNVFGETYADAVSLDDAVTMFVKKTTESYRSENQEIYDPETAKLFNFEHFSTMTVSYQKGNLVSYKVENYAYTGGANGLANTVGHIFDFSCGEVLFSDVFAPEAKATLVDLVKKHFADSYEGGSLEKMLEERCVNDFENLPLSENIYLTNDAVVFVYGTMEIACHAGGIFEIAVPISELTPYFAENSPLKVLVQTAE